MYSLVNGGSSGAIWAFLVFVFFPAIPIVNAKLLSESVNKSLFVARMKGLLGIFEHLVKLLGDSKCRHRSIV